MAPPPPSVANAIFEVATVQRNWKSARDQYRRKARQTQCGQHRTKKCYKFSHLLGFLDILMDVGPVSTNLPGTLDSASAVEEDVHPLERSRTQTNVQRVQTRRAASRSAVSSDSEPPARGAFRDGGEQGLEPDPVQVSQTPGDMSPCSRVDHAVLGYLRGREGADWAELYCVSLVPSFRALPAHLVPKMKVAVETLFESAMGPNPTEECFWLLAQWSLHGRGRYPSRGSYSSDQTVRPVNPSEHGAEPASDYSPFLEGLMSPLPQPPSGIPQSSVPVLEPLQSVSTPATQPNPSCANNSRTTAMLPNTNTGLQLQLPNVQTETPLFTPKGMEDSCLGNSAMH
ncbi:uncharacterized protein [Eleutherodactylus coqui]|uniref:uncharacterized protein isoform X1 n=1 Tax=Eleutherodactylus coqui TaxID=57060 RepID=UPI0034617CD4